MKSLYDAVKFLASIVPSVNTASANGDAVDTLGFGTGVLAISAGDIDVGDADETYVFSVEESDDGDSDWTAIEDVEATITEDDELALIRLEGLNTGARKRFLRAVVTIAGTTPSIACSAVFALSRAYNEPVN